MNDSGCDWRDGPDDHRDLEMDEAQLSLWCPACGISWAVAALVADGYDLAEFSPAPYASD